MIAIKYDADGRITNRVKEEKGGNWTNIDESKFPGNGLGAPTFNQSGVIELYYRPETPNDSPPDGSSWNSKSTNTIGVKFTPSSGSTI